MTGSVALFPLLRELRGDKLERRPIAIAGASELVPVLARELRAGGDPSAVREGWDAGVPSAGLVWIGAADEDVLRAASGARVPIVGITAGESLPYVLDTDLVLLPPGRGFPVDEVARALAGRLGERGVGLAARLPVLRDAVVDQLIRSTSRRNALLAAAVFVPRAEMPVLAARQVAMVLRIARAYRLEPGPDRLPEAVGVVGAGFGFRAAARALLGVAPGPAWAVRGTVAYAGTRSVGEAARLYFASRTTDAAMPSEAGPTLGA